jgi:predicted DNA-binding mobile mystery protein A
MKKMVERQIAHKIGEIKKVSLNLKGVPSWVQYIRKALRMSPAQLASRMSIAESSLYQLERQESLNRASLQSLKKAAEAMGCELVYAIIPRTSIESLINEQAQKRARNVLSSSNLHMEYEDQAVSSDENQKQFEDLCEEIKNSKSLWEKK